MAFSRSIAIENAHHAVHSRRGQFEDVEVTAALRFHGA